MPFPLIPFVLLAIPAVEIAVFIAVGSQIGILATLALVVATSIAGSILLRVQGFGVLRQIRQTTDAGRVPGRELVHGVMILAAGALLLLPGFVTDAIGLLLFIPAVRQLAWKLLASRIAVVGAADGMRAGGTAGNKGDRVIDLDLTDYSEAAGDSPWRKPDRS